MKRLIGIAVLSAGIMATGTSQAGGVSVGISIGGFGVGIGHHGIMITAPVVVEQPVVYAPAVYVPPPPPPVVVAPVTYVQSYPVCAPVYYPVSYVAPAPVVVIRRPEYRHERWERDWRR